jgi:endonuclease-3
MRMSPLFEDIIETLKVYLGDEQPVVSRIAQRDKDPFLILIGTIISLRQRDELTEVVINRLKGVARGPEEILALSDEALEMLIYPANFYKNKASVIKGVSKTILERYNGRVPDTIDELLKIKGIGRKTANLVVIEGYGRPGICVDTHVHRISNRFGVIKTKTPDRTEEELRRVLPKRYWAIYNTLLVPFGKMVCRPISPFCSTCPITNLCRKVGVDMHR